MSLIVYCTLCCFVWGFWLKPLSLHSSENSSLGSRLTFNKGFVPVRRPPPPRQISSDAPWWVRWILFGATNTGFKCHRLKPQQLYKKSTWTINNTCTYCILQAIMQAYPFGYRKWPNKHPLPNTSFLINAPSMLLKLYQTPLSNKCLKSNRCPFWKLLQNTRN